MSTGPVFCPDCYRDFEWEPEYGYGCGYCGIEWNGKFPVLENIIRCVEVDGVWVKPIGTNTPRERE